MKKVTVADGWTLAKDDDGLFSLEESPGTPYLFVYTEQPLLYRFLTDLFNEHYEEQDEG